MISMWKVVIAADAPAVAFCNLHAGAKIITIFFSIIGFRHSHARGGTTRTDALQKLPLLSFVNGCNVPDLEIAPVRKGRFAGLPPQELPVSFPPHLIAEADVR